MMNLVRIGDGEDNIVIDSMKDPINKTHSSTLLIIAGSVILCITAAIVRCMFRCRLFYEDKEKFRITMGQ